jgi:hypothetical protein
MRLLQILVTKMCALDGCHENLCPKWRKTESKWMITGYRIEGNGFLYSIVTDGKNWVHHYVSEMKSPLYILTPTSSTKRKFQDSNFCW